jgi:ribosomal protein S18 acetylase RimI-like enzyme
LADATGLFPPDGIVFLRQLLADSLGKPEPIDPFWLTDEDDGPVGVAYCEPERLAEGTWNLQLIAIHPDRQGQGRGTQLLRAVEQASTRTFYEKYGFEAEARIRDFYAQGDDKVVFRKVLAAS